MIKRIPVATPVLNGNEKKYVNDCLDSTWISSIGKYIDEFEKRFAEYIGVKHAISCSNGTVALHIPLAAYGVGPGDEIIVPTLTYIATANAVRYCGATPVLVDSEPDTGNIDPDEIEKKITAKTKGIIVVHLYGHPVDMERIQAIAAKHNLFVIEDAAESHGALYKGQKTGSIGSVGTFSFFGNKVITTGEGGMVTTNDSALAEKMRILKGQGMDPKRRYWFIELGYNYRMTNIQAAIGLAQLENIQWHLDNRKRVATLYNQKLGKLDNYLSLPTVRKDVTHSYWMYSIILKDNISISRDKFMTRLSEDGIETRPFFYPLHLMPPYAEVNGNYPVAESMAAKGINLPSHALLTEEDISYICHCIEKLCV